MENKDFVIENGVLKKYQGDGGDVVIPDTVTIIGASAFAECRNVKSIKIPDSVTNIEWRAFFYCYDLESITLPKGLTEIKRTTFYNCKVLKSIEIPSGVTVIEDYAFESCESLTEINIPASVNSIAKGAFAACKELEKITVDSANKTYHSAGNCLIETATKTLIAGCKNSVIPSDGSVAILGTRAFYACVHLTNITIPDTITDIEDGVFSLCKGLTELIIPDSVKRIGDDVFSGCIAMTNISIGNNVESIGKSAFVVCDSLESIYIPDSVKSIGETAFWPCKKLKTVEIPEDLKKTSKKAFNCYTKKVIKRPKSSVAQEPVKKPTKKAASTVKKESAGTTNTDLQKSLLEALLSSIKIDVEVSYGNSDSSDTNSYDLAENDDSSAEEIRLGANGDASLNIDMESSTSKRVKVAAKKGEQIAITRIEIDGSRNSRNRPSIFGMMMVLGDGATIDVSAKLVIGNKTYNMYMGLGVDASYDEVCEYSTINVDILNCHYEGGFAYFDLSVKFA